jgi:hypothetical protein
MDGGDPTKTTWVRADRGFPTSKADPEPRGSRVIGQTCQQHLVHCDYIHVSAKHHHQLRDTAPSSYLGTMRGLPAHSSTTQIGAYSAPVTTSPSPGTSPSVAWLSLSRLTSDARYSMPARCRSHTITVVRHGILSTHPLSLAELSITHEIRITSRQ